MTKIEAEILRDAALRPTSIKVKGLEVGYEYYPTGAVSKVILSGKRASLPRLFEVLNMIYPKSVNVQALVKPAAIRLLLERKDTGVFAKSDGTRVAIPKIAAKGLMSFQAKLVGTSSATRADMQLTFLIDDLNFVTTITRIQESNTTEAFSGGWINMGKIDSTNQIYNISVLKLPFEKSFQLVLDNLHVSGGIQMITMYKLEEFL